VVAASRSIKRATNHCRLDEVILRVQDIRSVQNGKMNIPTTNGHYFRPGKEDNAKTVLYEIDMLRFAKRRLLSRKPSWTVGDKRVYLEDFLLHCRNLIEFFGKPNPRGSDLTIKRPNDFWSHLPERKVLTSMRKPELWEKYDKPKNLEAISKYLYSFTRQRTVKKKWYVNEMYEDLRPAIEQFESLVPAHERIRRRNVSLQSFYNQHDDTLYGAFVASDP
jgi:hypothetical protein